ncbi:hypothetical protein GCM10009696_36280 [Kocuria himachalensis]
MGLAWNANARHLGVFSAAVTVVLSAAYAITLIAGLLALPSPEHPIGDPYFPVLEVLILLAAPVMVALMVAVHAWAAPEVKIFSLMALAFMVSMAGLTSSVHFVILTLSRHPVVTGQPWLPLVLEFRWPSLVYALEILAWDVLFALAVLCAAPVFRGSRLAISIRVLLILSGVLALVGLSGVVTGDMQLRGIGIIGYAAVFPAATALLGLFFHRASTGAAGSDAFF